MAETHETFFDKPYRCMHKDDPERLEQLKYHLETGDYFPLLATIIGFLEEGMRECQTAPLAQAPVESETLRAIREDLIHLHLNYEIQPKGVAAC